MSCALYSVMSTRLNKRVDKMDVAMARAGQKSRISAALRIERRFTRRT